MSKKNPRLLKIICAVTALITVLGLTSCSCTSCSCGGLGSLSNLISGNNGGGTTATTAPESSAEVITSAISETTAAATTATTSATTATTATAPSETTTTSAAETTTAHVHDWKANGGSPPHVLLTEANGISAMNAELNITMSSRPWDMTGSVLAAVLLTARMTAANGIHA